MNHFELFKLKKSRLNQSEYLSDFGVSRKAEEIPVLKGYGCCLKVPQSCLVY